MIQLLSKMKEMVRKKLSKTNFPGNSNRTIQLRLQAKLLHQGLTWHSLNCIRALIRHSYNSINDRR